MKETTKKTYDEMINCDQFIINRDNFINNYEKFISYPDHFKTEDNCVFLYLFKNEVTNIYKIGITNNPESRLRHLTNSSGTPLKAVIVLECEVDYDESPKTIEKYLHNYFKSKRTYGEWFNLSIDDVLLIQELFYFIEGEDIIDNVYAMFFPEKLEEYFC